MNGLGNYYPYAYKINHLYTINQIVSSFFINK